MPFLEHAAPISYRMQPHRIRARLRFRIRRGPRFILSYDDDATMQGDDGRPVDVTVSIEAAAMLRIAFGLENQWRAMARGALLAWGRRPWVALQAKGLMPSL